MELKLYHELLVRIPMLPLDAQLSDEWLALKDAIKISSEDFYEEIRNVTAEEIPLLPPRIIHSIWKYFNRGKYRPTPFGSFAGTGFIGNFKSNTNSKINISQFQCLHEYVAWQETENFIGRSKPVGPETIVFTNSSFYVVGNQIRYIIFEQSEFKIAEIDFDDTVFNILKLATQPSTAFYICSQFDLNNYSLLQQMVDLQLLIPNHEVNLIGRDYFDRNDVHYLNTLKKYTLAERKIIKGGPDKGLFRHVNKLVNLLANIAPNQKEDRLEVFKRNFLAKYEYRMVPIMEAVDPEVGIGYSNMEEFILDDELANSIEENDGPETSSNNFRALYKMLFSSITKAAKSVLDLEQIDFGEINNNLLPNTLGILCAAADDKLILEEIYGPSVNRISGRFSLIGEEEQDFCSKIAAVEIESNPDVLFFDISYNAEVNVDNINRRKKIYPYQLSFLNYDLSDQPLVLSDLYLTIRNGALHLVSRKLNKRLIPRISSAYNYSRSDLSVYRLLCDLQNEGISRNFNVNLSYYFPDMNFYPRVVFRNIIVSPAQWKLSYEEFLAHTNSVVNNEVFRFYLESIGLERYIITRTDDRTLCFDLEKQQDLVQLLFIFKKFKTFYIEEAFIAKDACVVDTEGRGYNSHLLLPMIHRKEIYSSANYDFEPTSELLLETERIFLPGSEWVFFEIYVHPGRLDLLLLDNIFRLITGNSEKISNWFFVRFDKQGQHLRLRIRVHNDDDIYHIIIAASQNLRELIVDKIISDFKIATYERELERYGADLIEATEMHFSKDSDYVIRLIKDGHGTLDRYTHCLDLLLRIRDLGPIPHPEFDETVEKVGNSFQQEFSISGATFKDLNTKFNLLKKHIPQVFSMTTKHYFDLFGSSLIHCLSVCPVKRRTTYMRDLFHMHVNRLFNDNQRSHEMIIYYFLQKEINRKKALSGI